MIQTWRYLGRITPGKYSSASPESNFTGVVELFVLREDPARLPDSPQRSAEQRPHLLDKIVLHTERSHDARRLDAPHHADPLLCNNRIAPAQMNFRRLRIRHRRFLSFATCAS